MIFTSYFGKLRKIPKDIARVGICKLAPKKYRGLVYRRFSPTFEMMLEYKRTGNMDLYKKRFFDEILKDLTVSEALMDLEVMTNGAKDIVLLCYDKDREECHRKFVSQWLNDQGVQCEEWDEAKHLAGMPVQMRMEF